MPWGCFAAGGLGALHKVNGKMSLRLSTRCLKFEQNWMFQQNNDQQ